MVEGVRAKSVTDGWSLGDRDLDTLARLRSTLTRGIRTVAPTDCDCDCDDFLDLFATLSAGERDLGLELSSLELSSSGISSATSVGEYSAAGSP